LTFQVLVADPPWRFGDALPGATRGASKQYDTMTVPELKAFELPHMSENKVLFMWRVSSMVEEAYDVVRTWGFTPKTEIVWQKLTKHGKKHFGLGRYLRASHETCIVATRGRCFPQVKNIRSTFEAPCPTDEHGVIHSAKPEEFFQIVEALYPGPYVELFSRKHRPGWMCLGNQVDTGPRSPAARPQLPLLSFSFGKKP